MLETNTLNRTVENGKILPDENATNLTDSRIQQEQIIHKVYTDLCVASELHDKQKRSEGIMNVLKVTDWKSFFIKSSPSEWKEDKEFKNLSILRTPNHNLILLNWRHPVSVHLHLDRRGGCCDAYVYCVKGIASHDKYAVREYSETEVIVGLPENELLLPGDVAIVDSTEAHAMGPLAKDSVLWTVHYYTGSIAPSNPNQRLKINGN